MLSDAERKRYFVSSGDIVPGGESTWYILDWDQRKTFGVTVDEYRFDEERAVEYLHNYVEQVDPDVCALFVSPEGELLRASSDAKDDCTYCVEFIPLAAHELPQGVSTICRSNLEELGRLGGNVDLVSCQENDRAEPRIVSSNHRRYNFGRTNLHRARTNRLCSSTTSYSNFKIGYGMK